MQNWCWIWTGHRRCDALETGFRNCQKVEKTRKNSTRNFMVYRALVKGACSSQLFWHVFCKEFASKWSVLEYHKLYIYEYIVSGADSCVYSPISPQLYFCCISLRGSFRAFFVSPPVMQVRVVRFYLCASPSPPPPPPPPSPPRRLRNS